MTGRNKIRTFGFGMLRPTVAFTIVNWCCVLVAHASILRLNDTSGLPFRFMEEEASWESDVCFGSISRVTGVAVPNPLVGSLLK